MRFVIFVRRIRRRKFTHRLRFVVKDLIPFDLKPARVGPD